MLISRHACANHGSVNPAPTQVCPPPVSQTPPPDDAALAIEALAALADPARAAQLAAHHKAPRVYLGAATPGIDALVAVWRAERDVPGRTRLAAALWDSDIFEARIAAAKLLTQARIPQDEPVWAEFLRWLPTFESAALADQACKVGERRLIADPSRLNVVETWVADPNLWVRRAALVVTLPWTRQNHPTPEEFAARERILGWAERLVPDRNWFIQKAVASWLHSLSGHDPARVRTFLDGPGAGLKTFARKDALRA